MIINAHFTYFKMYGIKSSSLMSKTMLYCHARRICHLNIAFGRNERQHPVRPVSYKLGDNSKNMGACMFKSRRELSGWTSFLHKNWPWLFKEPSPEDQCRKTEHEFIEPPAPLLPDSDPIHHCVTTEQLLHLASQKQSLSPKQYSVVLERLFSLLYSESFPFLTNSTSLFEFVMRAKDENEPILAPLRDSKQFQILLQRLENCLDELDKSDVVSCLYGLTYLRVPETSDLYSKLCVRLLESSHTGYTLSDLNKLHLIMFQISCNTHMYYKTFFPKMNKWFEVNKVLPADKEGLKQLIYIFCQGKYKTSTHPAVIERCIKHLDKMRKETDLIAELEIAVLILEKMPNLSKESVYGKQLDAITEAAIATVEKNSDSLTPFDINSLSYFAFHASINDKTPLSYQRLVTLVQRKVVEHIVTGQLNALELCSLLTNNFSQLTHRQIRPQERSEIKHQLHKILPTASFFSLNQMKLPQQVVKMYELEDILVAKIAGYIEHFDNLYSVSWLLKMLTTEALTQNPKLHAQVEQMIAQFYKSNIAAMSPLFQLQALTYFMSRPELMPVSLQLANKFADSCAKSFDPAQLMKSLNILRRLGIYLVNNHKLDNPHVSNGNLYHLSILSVYISLLKMLGSVVQSMDQADITVQRMISLLSLANQIKKDDPMLCEFSTSMFASLVSKTADKKTFISLPPKQIESLLNKETACLVIEHLLTDDSKLKPVHENLWYLLRVVSRFNATEAAAAAAEKLLTRLLMHDFEEMQCFDQVRLLSYCTLYYNLPVNQEVLDEALRRFFTMEKLQEVDRLLAAVGPITKKSVHHRLYYLNMYASFTRPLLRIPWFHDHTHISPSVAERNVSVGNDITAMFGGPDYVKTKVSLPDGFVAWKLALLDEKKRPVLFRPDNFLYSQELGLQRVCFSYLAFGEPMTNERAFQPYIQLYFDVLAQHVDKSILIYDHEWLSMGCPDMEGKRDLVLSKIDESPASTPLVSLNKQGTTVMDPKQGAQKFKEWALG